jgi:hypothetical protein
MPNHHLYQAIMLSNSKTLLTLSLACLISFNTQAENSVPNTDSSAANAAVEFKQSLPTTMEEIATVDVLGEICPKILGERMTRQFNQGYQHLVSSLLPNIPSPSIAIQSLRGDAEYNALLQTARADTAKYAVAENRAVCLDVLHYPAATAE